jgi:hypothetical protein
MDSLYRAARATVVAACFVGIAACASDSVNSPEAPALTVKGSAGAPPSVSPTRLVRRSLLVHAGQNIPPEFIVGDPSQVNIGMYALYLSENEDCSAPVLVTDNGNTAVVKDFAQNPVLFSGTPPTGTYKCVILRMSDVVHFKSATASANCALNTDYAMDIYRAPDTDWKNVDLGTIVGTGTDVAPSDDKVFLFATTDPSATEARGISPNQTILLTGTLAVPGTGTFYWNGTNSVTDAGTDCGMEPPQLSFQ